MGVFSAIKRWVINLFPIETIEQALDIKVVTSPEMQKAQELWQSMFIGSAPWNNDKIKSLMLPKSACKKVAKLTTLNLEGEVTGSPAADYLNDQFKRVITVSGKNGFRSTVERGNASGTLIARVFLRNFVKAKAGLNTGDLFVDVFETDMFYPIAFDEQENLTDAVFRYSITRDKVYYTMLERCTYSPKQRTYTMTYKAYSSKNPKVLGTETQLTAVEEWADLTPTITHYEVMQPWFATFVMPELGTDDVKSPMGSALFANAVDAIMEADMMEELTKHEFKAGRLKQQATMDLFRKDRRGNPIMDADVFEVFDDNLGAGKGFVDTYNPEFRDTALRNRLNDKKRDIEVAIGLAHGTLSDVDSIEKTATEIIHGREDTASTVKEIQDSWEVVLRKIIDIMYDIGIRYNLIKQGKYTVSLWWNDSIVVTAEEKQIAYNAELQRLLQALTAGLIRPEIVTAFMYENSDYLSNIKPDNVDEALKAIGVVAEVDTSGEDITDEDGAV